VEYFNIYRNVINISYLCILKECTRLYCGGEGKGRGGLEDSVVYRVLYGVEDSVVYRVLYGLEDSVVYRVLYGVEDSVVYRVFYGLEVLCVHFISVQMIGILNIETPYDI
jgi:hypothetical protein